MVEEIAVNYEKYHEQYEDGAKYVQIIKIPPVDNKTLSGRHSVQSVINHYQILTVYIQILATYYYLEICTYLVSTFKEN